MTVAPERTGTDVPDEPPVPEGHVRLTIDGSRVDAPKGELLIRACERLGIVVPRFCDHPLLDPAGACRQCLVEVEMGGRPMPKPQASCTMTVADGMVVRTQHSSAVAEKAQAGVMELLLINHPLDCPICDKGGECPLQNQAMAHGRSESRFHEHKRTFPKPIAISSQVLLDRERCVLCQRCTRFAEQVAGDDVLELLERGAQQQVGVADGAPFLSYFSGNTIQICPVGALTSAAYRFRSRPFDLVSTPGVCEHCASGCAQRTDWRRGTVQRRLARADAEVNEEWSCDKGRFAFRYLDDDARITRPLVRGEDGELHEASWTAALQAAATGLLAARDGAGAGVLAGGRLTVEDAYAYAKLARVALRTNDVDVRARVHSDEELDFLAAHVAGSTPATGGVTYADLEAAPAVLCVGLEPEEESPIVFLRLRKAHRQRGAHVAHLGAVVTPAVTKTGGHLVAAVPGDETRVLEDLPADLVARLGAPGAVLFVAELAAAVPGLLAATSALAAATGARLAWVPRRAG
ncbi:NADH-quinone oxidoreductase subunit G, partial [Rhodococcus aerolatus]